MCYRLFSVILICSLFGLGMSDECSADEPAQAAPPSRDSRPAEQKAQSNPKVPPVNPFPDAVAVPPGILDGGSEWLNTSTPIDLKDLRGKVVLLDFWTYCCINCIHVLPDLKFLEQKYEKQLVVIGVHSAKFDNEKLSENIRDAILRYEIRHPVVNDSEMVIWKKFGTRAWPTLALIDPEGKFIGAQGGEGHRDLFDGIIGRLVDFHRARGTLNEDPVVFDLEEHAAQKTALRYPGKILADAASNRLFISDSNHNRIVVTDLQGQLQDVIGTGRVGRQDGTFDQAEFDHPQGMELVGNTLYVADTENHLLRSIDLDSKTVTTLAGTGRQATFREHPTELLKSSLNSPWALCHIDGVLYIAMAGPHQIWSHRLGSQLIQVHAGSGREDVINGRLEDSAFAQPSGLAADPSGRHFFVADSEGSSIRQVPVLARGRVTTLAGTSELPRGQSLFAFGDVDGVGPAARFQHPLGVAWHAGFLYVADTYNHKIRRINLKTDEVTSWLGTGKAGNALGPVQFNEPSGLSISGGQLYIADTNNHRILVADLTTKAIQELVLTGVQPPAPPKTRSPPDLTSAVALTEQTVSATDAVQITVDLAVGDGFKLNDVAPVTWEVFVLDGDQVVSQEALQGRFSADVKGGIASFRLPLNQQTGTTMLAMEVSYGYCDVESENLCRLARQVWKFPLTVSEDATDIGVKLAFQRAAAKPAAGGSEKDELSNE